MTASKQEEGETRVRCTAVLNRRAWASLRRLRRGLDRFEDHDGHRAHNVRLRQRIDGRLTGSPRASTSATLARASEPACCQGFQRFTTHALWDAGVGRDHMSSSVRRAASPVAAPVTFWTLD